MSKVFENGYKMLALMEIKIRAPRIESSPQCFCADNGLTIGREFYARPVLVVARECVGKVLVHRTSEGEAAGRIVEAEAYRGPLDLAAHSARGLTRRTAVMFGPPGHAYVFRLYGTCWAMNLVTTAEGEPHAGPDSSAGALARIGLDGAAAQPTRGFARTHQRSRQADPGPAITGDDYGRDLCGGELYLEDAGLPAGKIGRSARINVDYAGTWAAKPWRFYERGNRYVSERRARKRNGISRRF